MLHSIKDIDAEMCRRSLFKFTHYTHSDYKSNWFNRDLCEKLEQFLDDVVNGKRPMLLVEAPPQHGKSEIVSKTFPAWTLGKYPNIRIVNTSYASSLAERNCRDTQRMMDSPEYKTVFPATRLNSSNVRTVSGMTLRNSEIFEIIGYKGFYKAVGVGGGLTGNPYDIGIIDDPFKCHEEAYSETIRDKVWHWYSTVFLTRRSPMNGVIVMNTRWHDDDLSGRLLDQEPEKWKELKYKAIATEDEPHRKKGEALHPERYDLNYLNSFKDQYPTFFAALYQQTPMPASGNLFNSEMFDEVTLPSEFDWTFIMADTAYKDKQENDYTVLMAFGVKDGELYIADMWRKQINASEIEVPACAFIRQYMSYGFRGAWFEPKGHGIYLNQKLPQLGITMPNEDQIKEFFSDRTKGKVERANNAIPYLGTRKIHINKEINGKEEILKEVLKFPKAKNDDIVDVIIDGVKMVFARKVNSFDVL